MSVETWIDGPRFLFCALAGVVACVRFARATPAGRPRFLLGAYLALALAYLGPAILFDPFRLAGASLLFVPLGILLCAPWRESLAALPLALAVARLGCLPSGCCYPAAWHALPELAGYVGLHFAARRWPAHTPISVLSGFGAIRLASLPLRSAPAIEPLVDPAWVAAAWVLAGFALRQRIGVAADAGEGSGDRTAELLRALVPMLAIWLVFDLSGAVFPSESSALAVASALALGLLIALRPPGRIAPRSALVCAASLLLGWAVSEAAFPGSAWRDAGPLRVLTLVVVAPAFEELLYRERLLGTLRSLWGAPAGVLLSSALFALGHREAQVLAVAFGGGLVCGVVKLRTGSLAAVIGLHAGWNLAVLL